MQTDSHDPAVATGKPGVFLPFLLMALALILWFGFQLAQSLNARSVLAATLQRQEAQVQAAKNIQLALSALATGTKQLAEQGNPNAAQMVQALAQRGINIADPLSAPNNPGSKTAKPPEASP